MNGAGDGLDARIAAQAERLAERKPAPLPPKDSPPVTVGEAANDAKVTAVATLSATLMSNGTALINMPESRDHFLALLNVLVGQGLERAAAAGRQAGAEEATRAFAANPRLGPLNWFRQKFGRAVAKAAP